MSLGLKDRAAWLEGLLECHPHASTAVCEHMRASGLPHSRMEDWRFTDLQPLLRLDPASLAPRAGVVASALPQPEPGVVQLVLSEDGLALVPGPASAPWPAPGVALLAEPLPLPLGEDLVSRLQRLVSGPALAFRLAPGEQLRLELLLHSSQPAALLAPRLNFEIGEGASLEFSLQLRAEAASLCLPLLELQLGPGASCLECQSLVGDATAVLLSHADVRQQPGSEYSRSAVVKGWALARQEPQVLQCQGAAQTKLRDLALLAGDGIADLHSLVRFEGPDGQLDQLQKALVEDRARSVFNGSVQVPRSAQRTDAVQLSRHLLLSDRARVDTKPQLEIVADDVRCSHGATVSSLADEELFYLQSRGLQRSAAMELLKRGFCNQILLESPGLGLALLP